MARQTPVADAPQALRIVLGRLVRKLRASDSVPLRLATVLARLDREGPLTTSELAALERMRPQSMAETVQELAADGLVEKRADPGDGRRQLVSPTPRGRAVLAESRRRREDWLASAIAERLSARERETLAEAIALLERLAED
ncbi:MAG TPA: MarR family transcriptional regulator [Gaiellaceae bacterium]|nr:MarR family transcriptional regulator [Gaiellaceae bacterium]